MSHLASGSTEPPRKPGGMRLYIMEYCPYALRPRLVLSAKGIPHDVVRINLFRKPEWYFKLHPEGKVPALIDDGKVVVESLDICEYIEKHYPQNPLYPSDFTKQEKDKEIIIKFEPAILIFNDILFGTGKKKSANGWLENILQVLQPIEDELKSRESLFFGGDKPMMVDFMLWPWAEYLHCITIELGEKLPIAEGQLPALRRWRKAMFKEPICMEFAHENGCEKLYKLVQRKLNQEEPDYDNLE